MSIPVKHSLKGQKQSIIQQNGVGLQGSKKALHTDQELFVTQI